jgi:hypothetical protein
MVVLAAADLITELVELPLLIKVLTAGKVDQTTLPIPTVAAVAELPKLVKDQEHVLTRLAMVETA